jgi:hypothetical protein
MGEMATFFVHGLSDAAMRPGQAPPRFAGSAGDSIDSQHRSTRHSAGGNRSLTGKSVEELEDVMRMPRFKMYRFAAVGMAGALVGALTVAPIEGKTTARRTERLSRERVIDRARVENLQRWVSAGHADWCKDARLVAAEELWRLAPDFSGDGFELQALNDDAGGGNRVTFEWAPMDGRAIYRVTVERFGWLLPIAKNAESIVWVPTSSEIRGHE